MHQTASSCEIRSGAVTEAGGSRIHRFRPNFRWDGVNVAEYKQPADHWCGIARLMLIGDRGENTAFHLRYFEIAPGGFSSLEHHAHEHAVVVLRGRGQVQLGGAIHDVTFGDTIYVAPHEVHQLRNPSDTDVFGFLCIVDSERDAPTLVQTGETAWKGSR
jgi:quercetin dioxygenase-like cupin family protein